jgi:pimeloyl-ACP methyl ester carboxylesterase
VRAIYLENGDYDAGMAALSDPAALDIPAWVIRGDPAEGGLIADEHVSALAERVGSDHVITIAGAGHSPQPTHPGATILAILRALA